MKPPSTPARFSEESSTSEDGETDNDETQMEDMGDMGQRFPSQTSELFVLQEESTQVISRDSSEGEIEDVVSQTLYKTDHVHAQSSQLSTQETQQTEEPMYDPSEDMFHGGQTPEESSQKKRRRSHAVVILPESVERKLGEWLETEATYFYDKRHPLYRDNKKKREDLQRMGDSFQPPIAAEDLSQWIITARTRYFYIYFLVSIVLDM